MEAVSLGTPVLTTDTSGFIELAERGLVRTVPLRASREDLAEAILTGMDPTTRCSLPTVPVKTARLPLSSAVPTP